MIIQMGLNFIDHDKAIRGNSPFMIQLLRYEYQTDNVQSNMQLNLIRNTNFKFQENVHEHYLLHFFPIKAIFYCTV